MFISYSWDSEEHKAWVLAFATRLRDDGIDSILDQTHLHFGGRTPEFMERSIRDSRSVLIICTEVPLAIEARVVCVVGKLMYQSR